MRQTRVGRCILDVCVCVFACTKDITEVGNACKTRVWVLSECVRIKCVLVTQTPFCPWKEVHAGKDCDTNEETAHWDNSDFLIHTHTHTPRCLHTPCRLFFYNSSSIFLCWQMSSFGMTGGQRADRAWPASQTPHENSHYSIHNSAMALLAGFTVGHKPGSSPPFTIEICFSDSPLC